jgi:hypothetical protein
MLFGQILDVAENGKAGHPAAIRLLGLKQFLAPSKSTVRTFTFL